jgi:transcriptional regulator with XRE-family HTH domain
MAVEVGGSVHAARRRRGWTLDALADRAGLSRARVQEIEAGSPASLEAYARLAIALGLRPEFELSDPSVRGGSRRTAGDLVHAAMGELEAGVLRRPGVVVAMDEPSQHYQFAGRADVVAWDLERRALLHLENRTQFPNVQDALGSYAAKRQYLPGVLSRRLGLDARGWASVSHAMVGLWSAEVLHVLRVRRETFASACPDPASGVLAWWHGDHEGLVDGVTSALVLLDPAGTRPAHRLLPMERAVTARPRYRDYADAAARLRTGSAATGTLRS